VEDEAPDAPLDAPDALVLMVVLPIVVVKVDEPEVTVLKIGAVVAAVDDPLAPPDGAP
jgi:hypothetical protein